MNQTLRVVVATVIMLCALSVAPNIFPALAGETITLREYLQESGKKIGCYFTVEGIDQKGWCMNYFTTFVVNQKPADNLEQLLDVVTNSTGMIDASSVSSNRVVFVAGHYPESKSVIWIRDAAISQIRDYPLDQRISIKYAGSPYGLINEISLDVPLVQAEKNFISGVGPIVIDASTPIKVAAENQPIRNILTDCINRTNYNRIIWSSWSRSTNNAPPTVTVHYYWTWNLKP